MSATNKAVDQLEFLGTLKQLATAYEEIAVTKMQRVKSAVLANREYITQLSSVFYDVKSNYDQSVKQAKKSTLPFFPSLIKQELKTKIKNGKTVSVFISSNDKLYGDIIKKIFHLFQFQVFLLGNKKQSSDIVIIGKYGKQLFDELPNRPNYIFFDLPDNNIPSSQITPLTKLLNQYEKVNVFYGKLENVMTQNATVANVSGEQPMEKTAVQAPQEPYFFEPSLKTIMEFFESQVFNSLFFQTLHETELARLASRIRAMEEALGNIDKNEAGMKREVMRVRKQMMNKKMLDSLSGVSLWKAR